MKKLIFITVMLLLSMHCAFSPNASAGWVSGSGGSITTVIQATIGQELLDLQKALDAGAITQEEYDELKLQIIERYDAPVDSTNTN